MAFSEPFGFLDSGKDIKDSIHIINQSQVYNGIVSLIPWTDYILKKNPLWEYIPYITAKESQITKISLDAIAKRQKGGQIDRRDLLECFMEVWRKDASKFSMGQVFSNVFGAM